MSAYSELAADMFDELRVARRGTRLDWEIAYREFNAALWALHRLEYLDDAQWLWWHLDIAQNLL